MDVKSTSGRQGHHLILFFPHFLARKFLLHLIRSSDSTSVPCIKGSLESYSYHYQLGHLLTHGIRYHTPHTHTCTTFISSLCLGRRQRKKKKDYSMPLFGFLIVVYFYLSIMCHILCAYMGKRSISSLPKHGSVLDPIPSFFI